MIESYYRHLVNSNSTGQNWFRHKLNEARTLQGKSKDSDRTNNRRFNNSLDLTFETFAGTRAISENLQLDRELLITGASAPKIDVDTIPGITIKEFDWDPHLKKEKPKLDDLAHFIPHDQHVVFVHSVLALQQSLTQIDHLLSPAFDTFVAQSVDHQTIPMYLRQLQLDFDELATKAFVSEIREIAITGSDPYSEIGTDLGIILLLKSKKAAKGFCPLRSRKNWLRRGSSMGIADSGFAFNADRSKSAYFFRRDSKVVLSNSSYQLAYLEKCMGGKVKPLAELKEFEFFRQRYSLTADETAFLFMSDAAIRRWCSAQWRITQSRRVRALSMLHQLQSMNMAECLSLERNQTKALEVNPFTKYLGDISLSATGVHSSRYGSIGFMTPISELAVNKVSAEEKQGYERWRESYQRNWSQAFDPIGLQLKMSGNRIQADLSVIPLILSTSYRWMSEGAPMERYAGDLHPNALIHLIASPGSDQIIAAFVQKLKTVEVYFDDDKTFWRDFTDDKEAEAYFRKNINRLPFGIALQFEDDASMKRFAEFAKQILDSSIVTETELKHKSISYLRLKIEESFLFGDQEFVNLHVLKHDGRLLLALNENLVKQAIDRINKPLSPKQKRSLLGKNMAIQVNERFFRTMEGLGSDYYRTTIRDRSWNNIPILNEWKREFPQHDPHSMHIEILESEISLRRRW